MEKKLKLKTDDGHIIYGTLNTSDKKTNVLAIFVHGLTGHPNEHTFHSAAEKYPKNGVDVFRFALYIGEKGGRKLSECTITTHADDLNKVLTYFRSKYKSITVIGHSLGSPTILKCDMDKVDVVVLWDPSHLADGSDDVPKKALVGGKEVFIEEWGTEYLINPSMIEEWKWFNAKNELSLIAKIKKPLKIISAGKGILVKGSKAYIKVAQEPKEMVTIKGASHCFDELGTKDELLKETLLWIKKYS